MASAYFSELYDWVQTQASSRLAFQGSAVKLTLPPKAFFKFPPADIPYVLPPPPRDPDFAHPFTIPTGLYNAALSPTVPLTFALVYVTAITYLNGVNKRRNYRPWAISRTYFFKLFVIAHNIFLSLYSLWTFIGMFNALSASIVDPREGGLAATVDSFCKLNGPRGHGSAATFSERNSTWSIANREFHLSADGLTPDTTDVGRIWNEGLAFYGWIFYLSKFYEVIDTLIIIAKGKKSSFLQTYHHAGAMMCMWAGIRYMSPPIWMFAFINSFIHTIMYTFYTCITVGIKVPKSLKRTLTTMQISQFVIGVAYAFSHYFVAYQIPVSVPYTLEFVENIRKALPSVTSDASSALSKATAAASADTGSWLKKLALRAAGREGLAENVVNQMGEKFEVNVVDAASDFIKRQETRYSDELQWIHCLDTSGQSFAIWLNILYLAPLTWLFAQFFIKSYLQRAEERRRSSVAHITAQSVLDARKGVSRRLSEAFEDYQGANGDTNEDAVVVDADQVRKEIRELVNKAQKQGSEVTKKAKETLADVDTQQLKKKAQNGLETAKEQAQKGAEKVQNVVQENTPSKKTQDNIKQKASDTAASVKKSVENLANEETTSNAADTAEKVKEKANELAAGVEKKAKDTVKAGKVKSEDVKKGSEKVKEEAKSIVKQEADDAAKSGNQKAQEIKKEPNDATVQKGKSFADAAAEGVPEEDMGEVVPVVESISDDAVKEEDDEGA